ncbi:DUF6507 family protein [Frondihabitans sp. VKM Ac-2883]|uniref:DUF6507 family protein n=1 Tax=Frondihabitans sp. VKM Ac-2883 TaxID=2783823 RepID=UPI00188AB9E4|nr:DUF6507 family protein [Frondihabitans sp. VKM Ac-2883]MBF4577759.1 hypothetical protein [Frondihabitans sp. VKM Ac-2883]
MAWKVDPAGVKSVLGTVQTESKTIYDAVGKVDACVQSAGSSAQSEVIGQALTEFFTSLEKSFQAIQNRIPASIDGAAAATNAILHGDEEMAATAEANAASSAATGNFDYFSSAAVTSLGETESPK